MDISKGLKKYFTTQLLSWHSNDNDRSLPWKNEQDPYKIWLSEIILQQTRALQGMPYYLRFTETYPTIADMAAAKDEDVFRIWQGLGYYNRCKNMLATARLVTSEFGGKFPDTYEGIISLKGIGPYTAAAIASFAYGLPHAVVDGNVYRVLSRYFAIATPFDTTDGKKQFATLAQELIDPAHSQGYNQAIMDLGATVCTPRNPLCDQCALQKNCVAFHQDLTTLLPVRSKKITVATRHFNYLVIKWADKIWLHKRTGKDIWENLHEPLMIETEQAIDKKGLLQITSFKELQLQYSSIDYAGKGTQRLTHRIIESRFFTVDVEENPSFIPEDGFWATPAELATIAFPKTVLSFLRNNLYF